MAYSQQAYSQKQGNGPYTLAEIGCFVTSFCNLEERFGVNVDPPTLNEFFIAHSVYIADPADGAGVFDDLYWNSISRYDPSITVTGIHGAGWPNVDNAIVEFNYISPRTGVRTTHFCMVNSHADNSIIDSWDGQVKQSGVYGTPVAWASYEKATVQIVTPPAPEQQPSYTIEVIPERSEQLKIDTKLWDLNQRSWPGLTNSPIASVVAGTQFSTSAIAHHILGGSYYMLDPNIAHGYNVVDCETPVVAPEPVPTPPVQKPNITYQVLERPTGMYVSKAGGCEKWNFGSANTWAELNASSTGHVNEKAEVTIVAAAHHPLGAIYYLDITAAGDIASSGVPAQTIGYNSVDLTEGVPVLPDSPTAVVAEPTSWTDSYRAYSDGNGMLTPRTFVIMKTFTANDLLYPQAKLVTLKQYDTILISGTFVKDGITYAAPTDAVNYVKNGVHTPLWPNIPLDDEHIMLHDELFSTTTTTAYREAVHTMTKRDYIVKAEGELVKLSDKFDKIWDVLPFRGKNKK